MTNTIFATALLYFISFIWFLCQPIFNMDSFIIVFVFGMMFFASVVLEVILFCNKKEAK